MHTNVQLIGGSEVWDNSNLSLHGWGEGDESDRVGGGFGGFGCLDCEASCALVIFGGEAVDLGGL